jgi:hypothetical protein
LPQLNQIYELDLAYGEYQHLTTAELVERSAYFWSIDGVQTHHYRICMNTPEQVNASARQDRKNFFAANVFAVGYATHGLFPYRGKFHPQMIKAMMNIMGLSPGDLLLDPMAGCGTTAIEASIIGINSIANELNPFACLMTRAKVGVLDTDTTNFPALLKNADAIFQRFAPYQATLHEQRRLFDLDSAPDILDLDFMFPKLLQPMRELLLLCFLDSVGYAARRKGKTPRDLFPDLLSRYLAAVKAFNDIRPHLGLELGRCKILQGNARSLDIQDSSVDGVLFSPPYSFAIDYLENDRPQLQLLGIDIDHLRESMVGLVGSGATKEARIASRVSNYFQDMETVLLQCKRVLKPGRYCAIVIGSNTNQTGGVSLENGLIQIAESIGMSLEFQIMREIEGIRNTMREEFLLFFRKPLGQHESGAP